MGYLAAFAIALFSINIIMFLLTYDIGPGSCIDYCEYSLDENNVLTEDTR